MLIFIKNFLVNLNPLLDYLLIFCPQQTKVEVELSFKIFVTRSAARVEGRIKHRTIINRKIISWLDKYCFVFSSKWDASANLRRIR